MSDDKNFNLAISYLKAGCEAKGVAAINFKDSELIMISKTMLVDLLERCEKSSQNEVIVMIEHRGEELREA